jgi:hypothetical protein
VDPATEQLLKAIGQIASNGVLGALVVILLWAYYKKDRALYEQSERFQGLAMSLQREVITAVNKIMELAEFIEKREQERESTRRSR